MGDFTHQVRYFTQRDQWASPKGYALAFTGLLYLFTLVGMSFASTDNHLRCPEGMVLIPAGFFLRGSNYGDSDEQPESHIWLPAYCIDQFEVTNFQFQLFKPSHRYPPGMEDHPVTNITWYEAEAYTRWVGKRLPTEAEWEKAARGEDGRLYPWGNRYAPNNANINHEEAGGTTPVGASPLDVSPYHVYDLVGNVSEWVADWYDAYPGSEIVNIDFGKKYKVIRGGNWKGDFDCDGRMSYRNFARPEDRYDIIGFRGVADPLLVTKEDR